MELRNMGTLHLALLSLLAGILGKRGCAISLRGGAQVYNKARHEHMEMETEDDGISRARTGQEEEQEEGLSGTPTRRVQPLILFALVCQIDGHVLVAA